MLASSTVQKYVNELSVASGVRYCTGCMKDRPSTEFVRRKTKSGTRYICQQCQARKSESWINRGTRK